MDAKTRGCLAKVLLFVVGGFVGAGMTGVLAVVLLLPSTETIHHHPGTPGVWVKEEKSLLFGPEYEVLLGPSENYGHVVRIPAAWGSDPRVVREADGIGLEFPNGGRIFVPASAYEGGR
ncbi:hypothetical protein [Saccharothrix obliqua]|uniref:hypothetical protein n=1 Tax=Saccharothrix obliqua TaxID=2861747 RepID=UPI001C603FDF|nr:hypothetical protein [Saccharothrix obliqua]MBW4719763.1 hypothetical protein [Saccharothrix obliqua]